MAAKCVMCQETVFVTGPDNTLRDSSGNKDCDGPYWVVRNKKTGAAVSTFFQPGRAGDGPAARARKMAKGNPNWQARRISPHGHQVKH